MKTELTDVSETRKHVAFEVEPDVVNAEIARVAHGYSRSARVPGFRPGKVPPTVVKQRYKDQILHDVAHDLIPRVVGEALRERGLEPVGAPDIKDVVLEEGQPLTFVADFETMPAIDPASTRASRCGSRRQSSKSARSIRRSTTCRSVTRGGIRLKAGPGPPATRSWRTSRGRGAQS